jgi:hypothetical protein
MRIKALCCLLLTLGVFLSPLRAHAGGKDAAAALKLDKQGQALEKKKAWEDARAAYQKSLELRDMAETRIRLAGVEEKLGNLVESAQALEQALEAKNLSFAARTRAKAKLKGIKKRIPVLALELPASFSGTVRVDDHELGAAELATPVPLNPGSHEVKAEAEGYKPFTESVTLKEKEKKNLTILMTEAAKDVAAAPPAPAEDAPKKKKGGDKTLAYVSLGVGAVGVVVGSVFALQAKSTKSELDSNCKSGVCSESQRHLYDKGKNQANIATVGFVVGAVGLGVGTVLLLTGGDSKEGKKPVARRVSPYVGPGSVGFAGIF